VISATYRLQIFLMSRVVGGGGGGGGLVPINRATTVSTAPWPTCHEGFAVYWRVLAESKHGMAEQSRRVGKTFYSNRLDAPAAKEDVDTVELGENFALRPADSNFTRFGRNA